MHKLFVYGTLKRNYGNHRCLQGSKYLMDLVVRDNFYLIDLGPFPALIHDPNNRYSVYGELYEIDDKILKRCDILEGYSSFYDRSLRELEGVGSVWLYYLNPNTYDLEKRYHGYDKLERWERTLPVSGMRNASGA